MGRLSGWLRIRILERDHYTCVYCGRRPPEVSLEVDHVLPRARGGKDEATNLVTACRPCNNGKRTGLIDLPDTLVLAPLPDKHTRRWRHVHELERAHSVREVIASGKAGSLNSGPSSMDTADPRILRSKCDLCAEPADTVHFVPWVVGCHEVVFACPSHDPGGYWLPTRDFDDGPPDWDRPDHKYTSRTHILAKNDGWLALALLNERLNGRSPYAHTRVAWRRTNSDEIVRQWA